jgi:hypothetical protein
MVALDKVFTALRDARLKLNASKCAFGVNSVTYLGHVIFKHSIEVDPDKMQAVRDFPVPKIQQKLEHFTAYVVIFSDLFPILEKQLKYLQTFCKKDAKLHSTDVQQLAFSHLKSCTSSRLSDLYRAFLPRHLWH